jgi:hypothetical protein
VSPQWDATVGQMERRLREVSGHEPIDPVKVARVLLDITQLDEPPLHLVLGRASVDMMAGYLRDLAAADEKWAAVGRTVDFDEPVPG